MEMSGFLASKRVRGVLNCKREVVDVMEEEGSVIGSWKILSLQ